MGFILDEPTAKAIITDKSLNNAKQFAAKIVRVYKEDNIPIDIKKYRRLEKKENWCWKGREYFNDALHLINNELEKLI